MRTIPTTLLAFVALCFLASSAHAQYFGRNKVNYDQFDFKTFQTEHFDLYYYPEQQEKIEDVARMAERWYERHSETFERSFSKRKPLIFYANDADFHQTNVTTTLLGEGTGGFTEPLQERVVMPLTGIYSETDHVLGHELVHSFQYDLAKRGEPEKRINVSRLPLWLIEGMAEYLSVGPVDAHTAMYLRDAALRDDIPSPMDLTRRPSEYFPYRYGHAFMSFLAGHFGEDVPLALLRIHEKGGIDSASVALFGGISADSLSTLWSNAIREEYLPIAEGRTPPSEAGRVILSEELDAGTVNLAPSVSPDGSRVAFLSERDLFNINLYLADVETREVIEDLGEARTSSRFDAIRFVNSAGTWSPDGTQFAFVTFAKGDNQIAIVDVSSGDIVRHLKVDDEGIGAIINVAWSPDGSTIAFSGVIGGISDLYLYDLSTDEVRRLTDDRYADLQPTWSPDGSRIAFVTDRGPRGTDFETLRFAKTRLAFIDVNSRAIKVLIPFPGATHTNPEFGPDGNDLFFLSDQDGIRDVYRVILDSNQLFRVTRLQTGITGITALSPAMSVASETGRMMFSVFDGGDYDVYSIEPEETIGEPVTLEGREPAIAEVMPVRGEGPSVATPGNEPSPPPASVLPPADLESRVSGYLERPKMGLPGKIDPKPSEYDPGLSLDYVAPPVVGASFGGSFGGGIFGGTSLYFSDLLGNHNLVVGAQVNGGIRDLGGQVGYVYRKRRYDFGGFVARTPLRFQSQFLSTSNDSLLVNNVTDRIKIDQVNLFFSYPFSMTRRIEFGVGGTRQAFTTHVEQSVPTRNDLVEVDEFDIDSDDLYFAQFSAALVGDNSVFGLTGPVVGTRYRFEATPFTGSPGTFLQMRADYRTYVRASPFTFAVKGIHVGSYAGTAEDDPDTPVDEGFFTEQYLGLANSLTFVRGYSFGSFNTREECTNVENSACPEIQRLVGSRAAVVRAEIRLPVLGVRPLSLANFPLPLDVALFYDAGLAWNPGDDFFDLLELSESTPRRIPVMSTGLSTRINLLGFTVLEMYLAHAFQRPEAGLQFGLQLMPGW